MMEVDAGQAQPPARGTLAGPAMPRAWALSFCSHYSVLLIKTVAKLQNTATKAVKHDTRLYVYTTYKITVR